MNTKLQDFLVENKVGDATITLDLGGRLKGNEFKVKAMTSTEYQKYVAEAKKITGKGAKQNITIDQNILMTNVVIGQTVDPDFKNADFLKSMGAITPQEGLANALLAGEFQKLSDEIFKVSGFGNSLDEDIEEAKNS